MNPEPQIPDSSPFGGKPMERLFIMMEPTIKKGVTIGRQLWVVNDSREYDAVTHCPSYFPDDPTFSQVIEALNAQLLDAILEIRNHQGCYFAREFHDWNEVSAIMGGENGELMRRFMSLVG